MAGLKNLVLQEIGDSFTNFMDRFIPQKTVTTPDERAVIINLNPNTITQETDHLSRCQLFLQNTFGSMMNTGIVTRPQQMQDVDKNVADALQLVPSEFQDVPTDLGSGIRIAPGSGANRFKFTTSTGANLPGLNPLGNVFDIIDARNLEKEILVD